MTEDHLAGELARRGGLPGEPTRPLNGEGQPQAGRTAPVASTVPAPPAPARGRALAPPRAPAAGRPAGTALRKAAPPRGSSRWSSSIAADRMAASGLAMPLPAMSGAEPCTGSNMLG